MYSIILPSGVEIELREMTGAEEELLTNQRLIRSGDAINQVLKNCILRIGENTGPAMKDVLDLLSGDRLFVLVRLRQISLGDEVELALHCPSPACHETSHTVVNLEGLEVTPYGPAREFEFHLPGSGQLVRFGYLDGHKEKRLAALKEPTISSAMLMRILTLGGAAPSKKMLAEMAMKDRAALRAEMARVDGGIDTVVEMECEACGAPLRTRLEAEAPFLFPAAAS